MGIDLTGIIVGEIVKGILKMFTDSTKRGESSRKYGSSYGEVPSGTNKDWYTTQQTSTQTYPHVQDPNYWVMSNYMMAPLLENYARKSGAGMPGGIGTSSDAWIADILEYLKKNLDTTMGTLGG